MTALNAPSSCRIHICPRPQGEGRPLCDGHWGELTKEAQALLRHFWSPGTPSTAYEVAEAIALGYRALTLGFWTAEDCEAFILETLSKVGAEAWAEVVAALGNGHGARPYPLGDMA